MAFSDAGLLQNPVAPNKQVVKLDVHSLLRGGNKVVKLRDTTGGDVKRLVYAFMFAKK